VPLPPGDDICQGASGNDTSLGCESNQSIEATL
jgi:hypothetical protein